MAEKYNANCSICGRPYHKCISCRDTMTLNPWKAFCCSSNHYKVHQVIRGFNNGVYTKDEAKNKFKNIDILDIENFKPHIKQIVEDILKEDESISKMKTEVVEKPVNSRKRSYKVNKVEVE